MVLGGGLARRRSQFTRRAALQQRLPRGDATASQLLIVADDLPVILRLNGGSGDGRWQIQRVDALDIPSVEASKRDRRSVPTIEPPARHDVERPAGSVTLALMPREYIHVGMPTAYPNTS